MRSALERCSKSGFRPPDPHVSTHVHTYDPTKKARFGRGRVKKLCISVRPDGQYGAQGWPESAKPTIRVKSAGQKSTIRVCHKKTCVFFSHDDRWALLGGPTGTGDN